MTLSVMLKMGLNIPLSLPDVKVGVKTFLMALQASPLKELIHALISINYWKAYLMISRVVCSGGKSKSKTSKKLSNCLTVTSLTISGSMV